ncbi:hypothetical protein [Kribbella sp. HUAS MG21]|uniref:BON domain-containing protein n=1 Tax=Kribbella sp. HUAS MG21 TaxID=3160966 RepID=A0AAU7T822_9ACTN
MTTTTGAARAPDVTAYELCLAGHLDDHWSAVLGDLTLTRRTDGTTTLSGPVSGQAQLHGILNRIRDLGTTLLSLRILDTPAAGMPYATSAAERWR